MKWNIDHITVFLDVYQHYPVLWNIKEKDYGNTKLKDEIFLQLFSELNENELIGGMDVKQLKAKIKTIKDVYRTELHKIEKSKKNGCGELYSPKLAWFHVAYYLADAVTTRCRKSNLNLSQDSQEIEGEVRVKSENMSPAKMRPPAKPTKRIKKRAASEKSPPEIPEAIQQLDKISQNVAEEQPYDQFGKFVASELRQLPHRQAILLQQELQNCIIRYKLSALEDVG